MASEARFDPFIPFDDGFIGQLLKGVPMKEGRWGRVETRPAVKFVFGTEEEQRAGLRPCGSGCGVVVSLVSAGLSGTKRELWRREEVFW